MKNITLEFGRKYKYSNILFKRISIIIGLFLFTFAIYHVITTYSSTYINKEMTFAIFRIVFLFLVCISIMAFLNNYSNIFVSKIKIIDNELQLNYFEKDKHLNYTCNADTFYVEIEYNQDGESSLNFYDGGNRFLTQNSISSWNYVRMQEIVKLLGKR